jgi:hypothetical protein
MLRFRHSKPEILVIFRSNWMVSESKHKIWTQRPVLNLGLNMATKRSGSKKLKVQLVWVLVHIGWPNNVVFIQSHFFEECSQGVNVTTTANSFFGNLVEPYSLLELLLVWTGHNWAEPLNDQPSVGSSSSVSL